MSLDDFLDFLTSPTPEGADEVFTTAPMRAIPANAERVMYSVGSFLDAHFASPAMPGPIGHGFTPQNLSDETLYYRFEAAPGIVGIMLDTVNPSGGADGSIGSLQAAWLEAQLQANSRRWVDASNQIVENDVEDRLIVVFSHHNLMTMSNATSLPQDPDPEKLLGSAIEALLLRYPNVILWLNGHSHVNRVWAHPKPQGAALGGGFWEVNTASHIDFPQQSRTVELVDNADDTLSIFAILFDHLAPPTTDAAQLDALGLAAISRELSANDPFFNLASQIGQPTDRNVELLIRRPF
jgi:metallophosphoesterase (TIGR03767 family)